MSRPMSRYEFEYDRKYMLTKLKGMSLSHEKFINCFLQLVTPTSAYYGCGNGFLSFEN